MPMLDWPAHQLHILPAVSHFMATLQNQKRKRAYEDLQDGRRTKTQKTRPSLPGKPSAETPRRDQTAADNAPAISAIPPAVDPPISWHYPPEFWDRLSTIPLIRTALEELDRRNRAQAALPPSPPPPPSPTGLTRDLTRFARHGGPDLRDLRGYRPPVARRPEPDGMMGSSHRNSSGPAKSTDPTTVTQTGTTKTKKSSTHNRGFEQHLIDYGIYSTLESQEPSLEAVHAILAKPRRSLSPSRFPVSEFKTFCRTNAQAKDENDILRNVLPTIAGKFEDNYPSTHSMVFGNLETLTDGTVAAPQPDIAWGALPRQLHPSIRNELQHHIVPSTATDRLLAPNFFLEAKGLDGSVAVMARQARYDGAFGARAMSSLQNYRQEVAYDGNAYTYSSTYHDGTLKMYAHHATAPATEGGRPDYHMTQIDTWGMTGNFDTFRRGAAAFRNVRDLAKKQRDIFIENANASYKDAVSAAQAAQTVAAEAQSEHDSSLDEFVDCEAYGTPRTPVEYGVLMSKESQQPDSQKSKSTSAVTEPAASFATSFNSSLPPVKSYNRDKTSSKRHRNSESPPPGSPSGSRRPKKKG